MVFVSLRLERSGLPSVCWTTCQFGETLGEYIFAPGGTLLYASCSVYSLFLTVVQHFGGDVVLLPFYGVCAYETVGYAIQTIISG